MSVTPRLSPVAPITSGSGTPKTGIATAAATLAPTNSRRFIFGSPKEKRREAATRKGAGWFAFSVFTEPKIAFEAADAANR